MTNDEKLLNYLQAGVSQNKHNDSDGWKMPDWVPTKVRMLRTVKSDIPTTPLEDRLSVGAGHEYEVESNRWGAVSAKVNGRFLGLVPHEFEVLEWVENPHIKRPQQAAKENHYVKKSIHNKPR